MIPRLTTLQRGQKRVVLLAHDALLCLPAVWLAVSLHSTTAMSLSGLWPIIAVLTGLCMVLSAVLGIADTRISAYEEIAIAKSLLLSVALAIAFFALAVLMGRPVAPAVAVLFTGGHLALCIAGRSAMAATLIMAYRSQKRRRLIIYGAGTLGLQAARALRVHPEIDPVGFVDDNPALHGLQIGGLKVHSPLRLRDLADRLKAYEVLIATPSLGPSDRARLVDHLSAQGISVASLPAFAQLAEGAAAATGRLDLLDRPTPCASPFAQACYVGQSVMITGAGGSIGSELAHQVIGLKPARLVLVDHSEFALYQVETGLRAIGEAAGVPLVCKLASITDPVAMRRVMADNGVDIVLHAAAYKHVTLVQDNPGSALHNNAIGTEILAHAAHDTGVGRFVLVSTDKAVRPASVMGVSKWVAEQVVRHLGRSRGGMVVSVVRFGNVLGSSGSVLPLFEAQMRRGGPLTVTDPRMERYFMSVEEAVNLVLEAGAMARGGEVFLFDMGQPVRVEALARRVIRAAGYTVREDANPDGDIGLMFTGARPGEKLREDLSWNARKFPTRHDGIYRLEEPLLPELELARVLRRVRDAVAADAAIDADDLARLCEPAQQQPPELCARA